MPLIEIKSVPNSLFKNSNLSIKLFLIDYDTNIYIIIVITKIKVLKKVKASIFFTNLLAFLKRDMTILCNLKFYIYKYQTNNNQYYNGKRLSFIQTFSHSLGDFK